MSNRAFAVILPTLERLQAYERMSSLTMAGFARSMGYEPAAHHQLLCDALDEVATQGNKRKIFVLPPGSAKSTYASHLFPGYYMARYPGKRIILASYNVDMAASFGLKARDLTLSEEFRDVFPGIEPKKAAANDWSMSTGSTFRAAGVGSSTTGRRADLLIIDDPVKDWEEAQSEVVREKHKYWWHSTAQTRLTPDASVLLLMTRWHEDDLAGYLLATEPERWELVHLRMECEDEAVDPLGRPVGARLWPEYFTPQMVEDAKRNPLVWTNLYQGDPTPKEGSLFKVGRIEVVEPGEVPLGLSAYMAHDLAATEGGGDWTAVSVMRRSADKQRIFVDIRQFQHEPGKRNRLLAKIGASVGPVRYRIPQDPGQAGKDQAQQMQRYFISEGVNGAVVRPISGNKETRAEGFAAAVNAGMVALVDSPYTRAFLEQLRQFPNGKHDDMVDAAADAYNEMMMSEGNGIRRISRRPSEEEQ